MAYFSLSRYYLNVLACKIFLTMENILIFEVYMKIAGDGLVFILNIVFLRYIS